MTFERAFYDFVNLCVDRPLRVVFGFLLLIATCFNFNSNYYAGKWLGFGAAFSVLLGYVLWKRFGILAALLVVYLLGNILWFLVYPDNRYAPVKPYDLTALKLYLAESGFKLLLILLPLLALKFQKNVVRMYGVTLAIGFSLINIGKIYWDFFVYGCQDVNSCGGLMMNPSLNSSLMAVTLPFIFEAFPITISGLILALMIGAVVVGKSSIGLGMVVAFLCLYFLSLRRLKYLLLSPLLLSLGWYFYGEREFLSSGDRFPMWEFFMSEWARNPLHWWFGTGYGSFAVFSVNLQTAHHMREGYWWVWMHNDWLEMLFTTGMVGLGLMTLTYIQGLRNLWKREMVPELQSLILFGVVMFLNYPLRIGLSCAFGAWLMILALQRETPHNQL